MIIKNLILIKNYNLLKKNLKRIIFLNEYHFSLFKKKKISNKLQYSILPKINYSKNERLKAYNECEKIYNSVIKDLVKSLNKIHNLDKTRNYWEIIIAHFLQRYIHICYYNYSLLKLAFRNKKDFYNIYSVNSKNLSMHNMFTFDLLKKADDYSWNFKLISKMIKFFKFNSNFIYKRGNFKTPTYKQENKFNKYLIFIIKFFDYLLSIFSKKKDILFYHSGIPFFLEKKIEIILGQVPRLISLYNLKFKFKNYDDVLRKQIILNEKKRNILENFIRNSLPLVLPISIVESFKDLLKMTNFNLFPKKPKIIFTAYKYDYDDFFKIYTAEKIQNNCKFFIYQHGNNYFTSIDGKHFPELKIANLFLTWGIKEKKKSISLF